MMHRLFLAKDVVLGSSWSMLTEKKITKGYHKSHVSKLQASESRKDLFT